MTQIELAPAPRFSIVVPAHNEVAFLGDCLRSLLAQDFAGRHEIIVVDNNSTDGTAELARSFGALGVVLVSETRPGVCWARQCGTAAARGEIIVSTDADTVFDSGWLRRIDEAFRADPAVVAVAGPCEWRDAPWWGRLWAGGLFGWVRLSSRLFRRVPYIAAANVAFFRSVFTGYDTCATQGGDELGLLRKLRRQGRVAFTGDNPVFTSARRMNRGLAYNIAVTFFFYYALGYLVNRVARRPVIGMAPAFRTERRQSPFASPATPVTPVAVPLPAESIA